MDLRAENHPYISAVCLFVIAFALQFSGAKYLGISTPFIFFFAAIAVASWIGGLRPGLFVTLLSTLTAGLLFIEPGLPLLQKTVGGATSLGVFALEGLLISFLFHLALRSRVDAENALEESESARARAEESDQLKRDFIANMSHELRAPLSSVLGYSELLASETISSEERKSYWERLKVNAAQLTHLVTDLLDVTEINSAYFVANRKRMGLAKLMQDAYSTFAPLCQEKGLKFQVQLRGSIPSFVESDPEQLMQLLRHVVGNAIKFSETGLVKLTITASKTNAGRREVALIVTDQGPGIPNEVKRKLFHPFAREGREETKTYGGSGVGLTIARKLARGLGGDVKLAKTSRRGTTFLITFDGGAVDLAQELSEQLAMATPARNVSPDDPHALDGVKILVVDDSPDAALLVSRMLKVVGADVETAERGQIGIEKAVHDNYDVVLMDIQMPDMDGNEATRRLRAQGFEKPIISLSAHAMKEDQEEARKAGADEYLTKPVSRRALLDMVGRYARHRRRREREQRNDGFDDLGGEFELQPAH